MSKYITANCYTDEQREQIFYREIFTLYLTSIIQNIFTLICILTRLHPQSGQHNLDSKILERMARTDRHDIYTYAYI